jgi:hypothetical protein
VSENAKFLYGPKKTFQIVTSCVLYGGFQIVPQAVLVECDEAEGIFKTHLVEKDRATLEEALEKLHLATTKLVYQKLSQGSDEPLEVGATVLEGPLEWE